MNKISLLLIGAAIVMCACNNQSKTDGTTADTIATKPVSQSELPASGEVAWVNLDTLIANYQMTKDLAGDLSGKMDKLSAEFNNKQKKFQANVNDFQNKAQKGLETRAKLAEMQQQLAVDEQSLAQLSQSYQAQMAEEQSVMQRKVLQSIMDYLKEYNKDKGYKYIHANTFPGTLLYADPALEITQSVIEGINANYAKTNPPKANNEKK